MYDVTRQFSILKEKAGEKSEQFYQRNLQSGVHAKRTSLTGSPHVPATDRYLYAIVFRLMEQNMRGFSLTSV